MHFKYNKVGRPKSVAIVLATPYSPNRILHRLSHTHSSTCVSLLSAFLVEQPKVSSNQWYLPPLANVSTSPTPSLIS